jgi:hypothetical protein
VYNVLFNNEVSKMVTIDVNGIRNADGFVPLVECADGFSMSVQGSGSAYCTPRNDSGVYTEMEVGFPSAEDALLMPFAEDTDRPTETVYGYVPVEIILQVIANHGGCRVNCLNASNEG